MIKLNKLGGKLTGAVIASALASSAVAAPVKLADGARAPGTSWRVQSADKPYSVTLNGDVFRFEIKAGDRRRRDPSTSQRRRAEITGVTAPSKGFVELSWDLLVEPASFAADTKYVLLQLQKGQEDVGDASGERPIVEVRLLSGGRPSLAVSGSDQKPLRDIPKAVNVWTGKPGEFALGVWHQLQLRLVQGGARPSAELWIDGVRRAVHRGKVGYPNSAPPYFRFGVSEASGDVQDTIVQVRRLRLNTTAPA